MATATAEGIKRVAEAIKTEGGHDAVRLRVAEQYVAQFGQLAKGSTNLVLPANVSDVGSMIALAMNVYNQQAGHGDPAKPVGLTWSICAASSQATRSRVASAFRACSASYHRTSCGPPRRGDDRLGGGLRHEAVPRRELEEDRQLTVRGADGASGRAARAAR